MENEQPKGYDDYVVSLGDIMRGERATLGKSLLDVQRDLRIKAAYIAAIENCDIAAFQTQGFIAGYVRSYARYLGLDADDCYIQFCQESGFSGVNSNLSGSSLAAKSAALLQTPAKTSASDPLANPRFKIAPPPESFFQKLSLRGAGSIVVMLALVVGLGYGALNVLQEVQRVQFAPIDQTPRVADDVAGLTPTVADANPIALAGIDEAPSGPSSLEQLYRPQELDVPQMTPRDGPIAAIDPRTLGSFAPDDSVGSAITAASLPLVTETGPPPIDVIAVNPAWIRVYLADGSVLWEQILDAGERYRLPENEPNALLRAGNSGSVFVMIGEKPYGPIGRLTGAARDVSLLPSDLTEKYSEADITFDEPLAAPVNQIAATVIPADTE